MTATGVLLLYALVGLACGVAVLRRSPSIAVGTVCSAVLVVPLWPLWAPFALGSGGVRTPLHPATDEVVARIDIALSAAVAASAGTPTSTVFNQKIADGVASEVARVVQRLRELSLLASSSDLAAARKRLEELVHEGSSERAVATARLQFESLERLAELRAADTRALAELADLLEVLRTQLTLVRFTGSTADDAQAVVTELWARLEGLAGAVDPGPT
jgi:hypothetical protein